MPIGAIIARDEVMGGARATADVRRQPGVLRVALATLDLVEAAWRAPMLLGASRGRPVSACRRHDNYR
jgi:hypothetical protein